jgi:hypothetical protein
VLTVEPGNVPTGDAGRTNLRRAATRETLRLGLLMRLALHITRSEIDVLGRPESDADAVIRTLETALQGAGRMQAMVQGGGLLGRETRLGLDAVDRATALVRRGGDAIGTAFLVGRDLVLTSAHVAVRHAGNAFVQELVPDLSFEFPVFAGTERNEAVVARPRIGKSLVHSSLPWGKPPSTLNAPPDEGSATMLDYALIRLDRQVTHVEPLDIAEPPAVGQDDALVVLGFAGGDAIKWDKGAVDSVTGERMQHKANTLAGMSGSCCIDVHGKPVGIHEGSLLDRKLGGNGNRNRAVCLSAIRNAMRSNGPDPLLSAPRVGGFAIYDDSLVRRTANAGLRILPPEDHDRWRDLVRKALGADPDSAGALPQLHPWFGRPDFEGWVDTYARDQPPGAQRLFLASGTSGSGKSFLVPILREKLIDALVESVFISATQTTAWSWSDAVGKLGIAASDERELRPHDADMRHVIVPKAADAVAERAAKRGTGRAPLFVAIDFEGEASFAAEESPWLLFMQELLGHSWIRLLVIGAPSAINAELIDKATVAGVDRYTVIDRAVPHVSRTDFRRFVEKLLRQEHNSVSQDDVNTALESLDAVLLQFPMPELRSACTALVGIMLQRTLGG